MKPNRFLSRDARDRYDTARFPVRRGRKIRAPSTRLFKPRRAGAPTGRADEGSLCLWPRFSERHREQWYIIFYDPSVPSHGRAVLVENNQITKTYPANGGGMTYSESLTFDPSRITSEGPVLSAAQGYAANHDIAYDSVRACAAQGKRPKQTFPLEGGIVFAWQQEPGLCLCQRPWTIPSPTYAVTFLQKGVLPRPVPMILSRGSRNDVKKTFLGIGGDLEEFFTGERTVDR